MQKYLSAILIFGFGAMVFAVGLMYNWLNLTDMFYMVYTGPVIILIGGLVALVIYLVRSKLKS